MMSLVPVDNTQLGLKTPLVPVVIAVLKKILVGPFSVGWRLYCHMASIFPSLLLPVNSFLHSSPYHFHRPPLLLSSLHCHSICSRRPLSSGCQSAGRAEVVARAWDKQRLPPSSGSRGAGRRAGMPSVRPLSTTTGVQRADGRWRAGQGAREGCGKLDGSGQRWLLVLVPRAARHLAAGEWASSAGPLVAEVRAFSRCPPCRAGKAASSFF